MILICHGYINNIVHMSVGFAKMLCTCKSNTILCPSFIQPIFSLIHPKKFPAHIGLSIVCRVSYMYITLVGLFEVLVLHRSILMSSSRVLLSTERPWYALVRCAFLLLYMLVWTGYLFVYYKLNFSWRLVVQLRRSNS